MRKTFPKAHTDVATAQGTLTTLTGLLATAKTSRMAAIEEDEKTQSEAMAATAAKLHQGISAQMARRHPHQLASW